MAQVTKDYFDSSPRKAETVLGWSRKTVQKGLKELETGIICADNYHQRGRKRTEENLLENNISTDPKFKSTLSYTRVSAAKTREALSQRKRI